MELVSKVSLIIHIIAGFTALATGAVAIFTKKGGKAHTSAGKIYYWAMTLVAITALILSLYKNIIFLLLIAIFSYYLTFTGYRSLKIKLLKEGEGVKALDWGILVVSTITSLVMIGMSLAQMLPLPQAVGLFGVSLLILSVDDYLFFTKKKAEKQQWLYRHIRRMCGAYIATFTAFLVVNIETNPAYLGWILPTVIGTPLIAYTIRTYKKKFQKA
ncbi:MAG: hypothetical protein MUE81_17550 [Thermoflexibacter sp.]|nr:hypothetical protein [Thermoflexibacter sp.]